MPIYEYRCRKCETKFEVMRGISDKGENIKCPKCGAEKPEKVFSVVCGSTHGSNKGNLHIPT